ncbi:MAG: hypothetical protein SH868_14835 [Bythopirellula sp.]|nr:hypothetical protein [Bythopirellula sp.]
MKFALLGADSESCLLVQAAADLGHEIVWYGDVAQVDRATHPWLATADQGDDWETLFDRDVCDFVIVGQGDTPATRRVEQVIQLVRIGRPLLITFPLDESVLSYYEIDMARLDSGAVLYHFNPLVSQTNRIEEFATWIRDGHPQLGAIEQVICERPLAERSRENDLWHFARDVELLDNIAGPLDRLGALGSPDESATYSGLSVQLLGKSQVPVRWSVGPADQSPLPSLTFIGQQGRARFEFDESGVFRSSEGSAPDDLSQTTAPTECLNRFIAALDTPSVSKTTWLAALRAMELTDTIEISLRRGRMIDVHRQQLTEELSFRGTMSAWGCGVLMVLPPLLLLAGWFAELLGLPIANYWAHGLFAILALFLLIQFAPKLLLRKKVPPEV